MKHMAFNFVWKNIRIVILIHLILDCHGGETLLSGQLPATPQFPSLKCSEVLNNFLHNAHSFAVLGYGSGYESVGKSSYTQFFFNYYASQQCCSAPTSFVALHPPSPTRIRPQNKYNTHTATADIRS